MPPTDDEIRVNGELQALAAELERVMDGRNPNRGASLELARKYRALHASLPDHTTMKAVVGLAMMSAAEQVHRVLGTAAWDEPPTLDEALSKFTPLPAARKLAATALALGAAMPTTNQEVIEKLSPPLTASPPLTDEELAEILGNASSFDAGTRRLVAEVRRLRSDEWVRAAAQEILRYVPDTLGRDVALVDVAGIIRRHAGIIRRHRDGTKT